MNGLHKLYITIVLFACQRDRFVQTEYQCEYGGSYVTQETRRLFLAKSSSRTPIPHSSPSRCSPFRFLTVRLSAALAETPSPPAAPRTASSNCGCQKNNPPKSA